MTRITVTNLDIRKGVKDNTKSCAVARAVKRTTKGDVMVTGAGDIYVDETRYAVANTTDGDIAEWISRFDQGMFVEPFQFDLVRG